jgi:hypothetical protein
MCMPAVNRQESPQPHLACFTPAKHSAVQQTAMLLCLLWAAAETAQPDKLTKAILNPCIMP